MHTTRFFRDTSTSAYKARCTCGWAIEGTLSECQTRAATHDLDLEEIPPAKGPHIVTDDDFISGLS